MLNATYAKFEDVLLGGFGALDAEVTGIFKIIAGIALLSMAINYLINPKEASHVMPLSYMILCIVMGVLIDDWEKITQGLASSAWWTGSLVSGAGSINDYKDFDGIIMSGFEMAAPLVASIKDAGWSFSISVWFLVIWNFVAAALLIGAYVYLALILFILMLTWMVVSLIALISMCFSVWSKTAFMAEGAFKFVAGHSLSIMGMGIMFSTITGVAMDIKLSVDTPLWDTLINVLAALVGVILALKTQEIIQGYFSGSPNLSSGIGGALRTMMLGSSAVRAFTSLRNIGFARSPGSGGGPGRNTVPPASNNNAPRSNTSRGVYGGTFRTSNARRARP